MNGYYSRYANNLFLTYIFLNVYKIGEVIGIQNGYFLLLFIQSIMFSAGGFLIYKIADMYFKEAQCQEWGYKNSLTRLVALFS